MASAQLLDLEYSWHQNSEEYVCHLNHLIYNIFIIAAQTD